MAQIGRLDEYKPENESWSAYIERAELFMIANDVDDTKQVATLLSAVGASTYGLLRNLVQPAKPKDKTFEEIVNILKAHFEPKPLIIAERFRFQRCVQKPHETVSQYVAELKQCASKCDFGASLDESLRDRFVSGIRSEACQRRLLSEDTLTFARALEVAHSMETADRDTQQLRKTEDSATTVHKVNAKTVYNQRQCYRCKGKNHNAQECYFKNSKCHNCGVIGHIKRACKVKMKSHPNSKYAEQQNKHKVTAYMHAEEPELEMFSMLSDTEKQSFRVNFTVNQQDLLMEIDTGAAVSIISQQEYRRSFAHLPLEGARVKLKTYTGECIPVLGQFTATVQYEDQVNELPLIVVKGNGPNLCGRNWLQKVKLNWKIIRHVSKQPGSIQEVLDKYSEVFKDELGTLKDIKATISVKPDVPPKFFKSRPLPFAMKERVEKEIDRLEKANVISPVKYSEWAAPVVPVIKKDSTIRLCGDYKVTVNQAANTEVYPLPRIEEVLATLSGGKLFSKIDLAQAYQQVVLDNDSKKYTTINTHKGLYVYNRLAFGISSAPSIFQRIMENLMKDLKVIVYLDDLLITGKDEQEHLTNICKVLQRLQESGLRVKKCKCEWGQTRIEYLGHVIDEKGVYPTKDKVKAIQDAPAPSNVKELRAFLGLVNYYGRFVPQQSTVLAPLYRLLKEQTAWCWGKKEQGAFSRCKELLTSDKVLVYYDPQLPLTLACDASAYGIGAVLQHIMPNGDEHPIAYASRTLSPAEKKYSQIEKEALSVIYGVKKFHQYLWGRSFNLITDHRPLVTLFGEHKHFPMMAAARIQRWAIILSAYDYHIMYRKAEDHGNADGLSRIPLPEITDVGTEAISANINTLLTNHLQEAPLNAAQIARMTRTDQELSKVFRYVMEGWPIEVSDDLKVFYAKRDELSVEQGCLLWGTRVIVPFKFRKSVLQEIHSGHPGIVKMKALTRKYVWWPKIDTDIERVCKECQICQQEQRVPSHVPLHPWEFPGECWKRLHVDFAGPFLNNMFMIIVDAHSKWLEVFRMSQITSQATITRLKRLFSAYGLPEQIVTDNATTFTSDEFQRFVKQNGIMHTRSAPKHPATNGLAERYVQTFKRGMKKLTNEQMCIDDRLSLFLLRYRTTPNCTTGQSPSDLFLKRHIRTRLDFLKPNIHETVRRKQYLQKNQHDYRARERSFAVDDSVFLRSTVGGDPKWLSGVITQQTGPVSYKVRDPASDTVYRRHGDQLRSRTSSSEIPMPPNEKETAQSAESNDQAQNAELNDQDSGFAGIPGTFDSEVPFELTEPLIPSPGGLRRSKRTIKLPQRFRN